MTQNTQHIDNREWLASSRLFQKIHQGTAEVGIVGLGYVGLPTMIASAQAGYHVTGIDINRDRVAQLNSGTSYIDDVSDEVLSALLGEGRITSTTNYQVAADLDVIIICVPTPVDQHKEPVLGPLQHAVEHLSANLKGEQLIVLQSTTFPGTTTEMVLPQLEKCGRRAGQDFYLAFSPERIDPGNSHYTLHNIPKAVGGVTERCTQLGCALFSRFVHEVIPVSSPKVAEMTKLLENTFRSVNIALMNELSEACQRMDIDIWEVINIAASKPFGFMPFYPGVGVGGHCIPVDPFYLSWKAKEYDCYLNFIELAARINDNRPYYIVSRIVEALGDRRIPLKEAKLLLLGISFKANIRDTRNSPALRVAELLVERGANIAYSDNHVPEISLAGQKFQSIPPEQTNSGNFDATIVLVNHSYYNLEKIVDDNDLVLDAVGATRSLRPRPSLVSL